MKHFFRISTIFNVHIVDGIALHPFTVYNIKNEVNFTFLVMNTGYDLSEIQEGDIIQFESRKNLSASKKEHQAILFEVRPNLETFNERDIIHRSVKDGDVSLMIKMPNILTYPIVKYDNTKRHRKVSKMSDIICISIEKGFRLREAKI